MPGVSMGAHELGTEVIPRDTQLNPKDDSSFSFWLLFFFFLRQGFVAQWRNHSSLPHCPPGIRYSSHLSLPCCWDHRHAPPRLANYIFLVIMGILNSTHLSWNSWFSLLQRTILFLLFLFPPLLNYLTLLIQVLHPETQESS